MLRNAEVWRPPLAGQSSQAAVRVSDVRMMIVDTEDAR